MVGAVEMRSWNATDSAPAIRVGLASDLLPALDPGIHVLGSDPPQTSGTDLESTGDLSSCEQVPRRRHLEPEYFGDLLQREVARLGSDHGEIIAR